jgi:hypothetical protein
VTKKLTNLTYALKLVHGRKRLVDTVHVCNLKPFHPRFSMPTPDISLFPRPLASVSRDSTEDMSPLVTSEHDSVPSKPTSQLPLLPLPTPELVAVPRVCAVGTDKPISTLVRRPRSRLIYDNLRPRKGLAIADRLRIKKYRFPSFYVMNMFPFLCCVIHDRGRSFFCEGGMSRFTNVSVCLFILSGMSFLEVFWCGNLDPNYLSFLVLLFVGLITFLE